MQFLVQQEGGALCRRGVTDAMRQAADRNVCTLGEYDGLGQGGEAIGNPIGMSHQQRHAGFAGRSGRQGHDDGASRWVNA